MIRSIIVDDERPSRETLSLLLRAHCPTIDVVACAESAQTAVETIAQCRPDLIFLDVEMPYGDGFELLHRIRGAGCDVIFVTAYHQYAIRAIKMCALDYLLKPVDEGELVEAVDRAVSRISARKGEGIDALLKNLSATQKRAHRIALPTVEDLLFVRVGDIIRCEASGNYTVFHLVDGQRVIVSRTLKEYEAILADQSFQRVHNSHLVNLEYVRKYIKGDGGYVVMSDNAQVMVARRKKDELLRNLAGM